MALLVLELEQADRVAARVHKPGRECKADVGHAVNGLKPGLVVPGDIDSTRAQYGHFGGDVAHAPRRLRLCLAAPGAAPGEYETTVAAASEGDEVVGLEQDLEPDLVAVELFR